LNLNIDWLEILVNMDPSSIKNCFYNLKHSDMLWHHFSFYSFLGYAFLISRIKFILFKRWILDIKN